MDEHRIAELQSVKNSWPPHRMHSPNGWVNHASVDEVDVVTHGSQLQLQSPLKQPSVGEPGRSSRVDGRPLPNPFDVHSAEKRPNAVHASAHCHTAVDGCAVALASLDGLCASDLPTGHSLDILPPLSHVASHTNMSLQQDPMNASASATRGSTLHVQAWHGARQQPRQLCDSALSQSPPGNPLDFAFLDAPSMPSIPGGSPCHNPWSPHSRAATLDDPLMHPLPFIDGTNLASPTPHVSISASGCSDSHSPSHRSRQLDSPDGGFLPLDSHTAAHAGGTGHHSDCLATSSHSASISHAVYKNAERPAHLSHASAHEMLPVYLHSSLPTHRHEFQSHCHSGANRDPTLNHVLESISQPEPSTMKYAQTRGDTTGKMRDVIGPMGLSCSAPTATVATRISSAVDAFDYPFGGFHPMDDHPTASLFDLSPNSQQPTQAVPMSREHSLRMLHTSLCNVGSASERGSLDLVAASREGSSRGATLHCSLIAKSFVLRFLRAGRNLYMGAFITGKKNIMVLLVSADIRPPAAAPSRSSHFKPVMIPSDPARLPCSLPNQRCATHLQPLSGPGAAGCSLEHAVLSAPHTCSNNTVPHWYSMHNVSPRGLLELSEGRPSVEHSLFAMHQTHGEEYASGTAPFMQQMIASEPHKIQGVPLTSPLSIPGMQHPQQFGPSHLGRGVCAVSAVSAPGRMPQLNATAHEAIFSGRHLEDEDTVIGGDCMHECTVRGGRALQAQLLMDQEGSTIRPVMLRATPTGRSAPRRSGTYTAPP